MKRITLIVPNDTDIAPLTSLFAMATFLSMETIEDSPPEVEPSSSGRTRHLEPGVSRDQSIMNHFTPSGTFHRLTAQKWMTDHNYAPTGSGSVLSRLVHSGHIRRLGSNKYQFVKKLETRTATMPQPSAALDQL